MFVWTLDGILILVQDKFTFSVSISLTESKGCGLVVRQQTITPVDWYVVNGISTDVRPTLTAAVNCFVQVTLTTTVIPFWNNFPVSVSIFNLHFHFSLVSIVKLFLSFTVSVFVLNFNDYFSISVSFKFHFRFQILVLMSPWLYGAICVIVLH